jgi:hypothetical protein
MMEHHKPREGSERRSDWPELRFRRRLWVFCGEKTIEIKSLKMRPLQ